MKFFQVLTAIVATVAALGSVADKEKNSYTALFAVAGVLFLASCVIQKVI